MELRHWAFLLPWGGSYKVGSSFLKLYLEIRLRLLFFYFKFDVGFGIECDFFPLSSLLSSWAVIYVLCYDG